MTTTTTPPPLGTRPPKKSRPGRVAIVIGLISVFVFCLIAIGASQRTGDITGSAGGVDTEGSNDGSGGGAGSTQPAAIESVSPTPADVVGPQPYVVVDLSNGYTGALQVDGIEIPDDQTIRVDGLGTITFRPGPGADIESFEPGTHTARVIYWPITSTRSDSAETFDWSFRVGGV